MNSRVFAAVFLAIAVSGSSAWASFITFQGGLAEEADWVAAAGTIVVETFDSFGSGDPIASLPTSGVGFDEIAPGRFPAVYVHHVDNTPSGRPQLSNMPSGVPESTFQFADFTLRVLPGFDVTAIGFWNGDPQGDMVASVFDASNVLLGTVTALLNSGADPNFSGSFAGFVSSTPIAYVHFEGQTGDGWNHIDDLGVAFHRQVGVPEPGTLWTLLPAAIAALVRRRAPSI